MKNKTGDILFIFIVNFAIVICFCINGIKGLYFLTISFFLPLYLMRFVVWSFWPQIKHWLSINSSPKGWIIIVFSTWGILATLFWIFIKSISTPFYLSIPLWLKVAGVIFSVVGMVISLWAQWLLGLQTAILTTRIYDARDNQSLHIVKTGPYRICPHPIFLGEWLIILGCFLLTSEIFLLPLLVVALLSDNFAAKKEENDLQIRFGKEYLDYRSNFKLKLIFTNLWLQPRINTEFSKFNCHYICFLSSLVKRLGILIFKAFKMIL